MSSRPALKLSTFLGPLLSLAVCGALTAGCAGQQRPSLRVVAVERADARSVLLVQVTNPENRSIRLQRLQYTFAGAEHTTAPMQGEILLSRDVAAGAAVIVEVPVDQLDGAGPFTLEGNLEAVIDRIVRIYPVTAQVDAATRDAATPPPPIELPMLRARQPRAAAPSPPPAPPAAAPAR